MRNISPVKAALSVGSVIGLYHVAWAALVAMGLAKPFMDFVLRLHFIQFNYQMAPFDLATAAGLVALTFSIGAAFGLVFALVWNWLASRAGDEQITDPAIKAELAN
jgi:NhaP-type Na+/H+ or K+/H+ antiporter